MVYIYTGILFTLFIILISINSLFSFYFYFELQWIIISLLFLIGNSLYRGLISYLIVNSIISIWILLGILTSNSFLFILSLYSKLGYFPFVLINLLLINSGSFSFLLIDLLFKWCYITALINWNSLNLWNLISDSVLISINLFIINLVTVFLISLKHVLFISSQFLILFLLLLLVLHNEFYCFHYYITYITINYSLITLFNASLRDWLISVNT